MLKPEQIPDEVVKAFEEEYHFGEGDWKRNVIAAAINAWPGTFPWTFSGPLEGHGYVLPLPKEPEA